jgi:hypothetical protein
MCLIVAVEQNRDLPLVTLQAAILSAVPFNPDGIGLTYGVNGEAVVEKSIKGYNNIIDKALQLYWDTTDPFVLHLRYNTVGSNSNNNTHPFRISKTVTMAHNKTLDIEPPSLAWSDSRTVAELLRRLCKADREFFGSPLFYSFIEHHACTDNRFVFLDAAQKSLTYVNEHLGVLVDGIWFSNTYSWRPATVGLKKKTDRARLYEQLESVEACDDDKELDCLVPHWDSNDLPMGWAEPVYTGRDDRRERDAIPF